MGAHCESSREHDDPRGPHACNTQHYLALWTFQHEQIGTLPLCCSVARVIASAQLVMCLPNVIVGAKDALGEIDSKSHAEPSIMIEDLVGQYLMEIK